MLVGMIVFFVMVVVLGAGSGVTFVLVVCFVYFL